MLQTLKHNCFKIVPLEDCIDLKTPFREGKLMRIDTQHRFRKLKGGGGANSNMPKKTFNSSNVGGKLQCIFES